MPRVILGSPLFNHAAHFREAIESVLNQTFTDFALVLVDDRSTDETPQIAREYEALDSRVWFCQNDNRLGLIDNSRKALALARDRHPDAEYFAWVSDHDLWHPRWLWELVDALDANPEVVLAYPLNRRIGPSGEVLKRLPWRFDTLGLTSPWARLRVGIRHMRAGNMVYGCTASAYCNGPVCTGSSSARPSAVRRAVALRPVQAGFTRSSGFVGGTAASSVSNANGPVSFRRDARCMRTSRGG